MRRPCAATPDNFQAAGDAYKIRRATAADLSAVVEIHRKTFSSFFLTRLGRDFLLRYYSLVLNYQSGIVLVSEQQDQVHGFACGFVEPAVFYRLMWREKLMFATPVLRAVVRHPSLLTRVVDGIRRICAPASEWPRNSCELSSIAVAPEHGGNGFGKALIGAFLDEATSMCARRVYLTTDADGNDAVNAFYRDAGFQQTRRFLQSGGRWMNEYVIGETEAQP